MIINPSNLSQEEQQYITASIPFGGPLELKDIWLLMDEAWELCKCDPLIMDDRILAFYNHPVWLLNGLFIEQDSVSLRNREIFSTYISTLKPKRVADFGGGVGCLARMIGKYCPDAEIDIIEPYPHALAIDLANHTTNVRYRSDFKGKYDVIVATDVFEHVNDPLLLVQNTACHLEIGGKYLIANNFYPVIKCHLPSVFHFRWSWDAVMKSMNLLPGKLVSYGRVYTSGGTVCADDARKLELTSKKMFKFIETFPRPMRKYIARLIFVWR